MAWNHDLLFYLKNEVNTANVCKHELLPVVNLVDVTQSLTEIARQRMMEDGVESYRRNFYPGAINYLRRTSS